MELELTFQNQTSRPRSNVSVQNYSWWIKFSLQKQGSSNSSGFHDLLRLPSLLMLPQTKIAKGIIRRCLHLQLRSSMKLRICVAALL